MFRVVIFAVEAFRGSMELPGELRFGKVRIQLDGLLV